MADLREHEKCEWWWWNEYKGHQKKQQGFHFYTEYINSSSGMLQGKINEYIRSEKKLDQTIQK